MRRFVPVVPALTLWLCWGVCSQVQPDEARALLAKAIKAHGGAKALATLSTFQQKGKGQLFAPFEAPFTAEIFSQAPDKNKLALEVELKGATHTYIKVLNGAKGWVRDFTRKTNPMDAEDLAEAQQMMTVERAIGLVALTDKGYQLSSLGKAKVEGRDAVGLRATKERCRDVSLFFDSATHLLLKVEYRALNLNKEEVTQEKLLSDYKTLPRGLKVPGKMVINNDGKRFVEFEITETTAVDRHDDSVFAKP
jgi:hypothetical protein